MPYNRRTFLSGLQYLLAGLCAVPFVIKRTRAAGTKTTLSLAQGQWIGEPTAHAALLQTRLTASTGPVDGDVPGADGVARFEISRHEDFRDSRWTDWIEAVADRDYVVRSEISDLQPGTKYYYRPQYGPHRDQSQLGPIGSFTTLPGEAESVPVDFVVWSCMNYAFFHRTKHKDSKLGYPALEVIHSLHPDFIVATGDNVYYDHPIKTPAKTPDELRKKWHEQFVMPRFVELLQDVPVYWEKDDHDFRYDDSDLTVGREPSVELGHAIFREQVPILPVGDEGNTYRTHRISRDLQIWLVEGRDYRTANNTDDSAMKSLWGETQYAWLQQTLKESDAAFKIIISPTPLVGPDRNSKRDNHTNLRGFHHEREEFFAWLKENDFSPEELFLVCGDRHWQYHAIHPSGFQEFSVGALHEANAVPGILAGQPGSTDPEGLIKQKFLQREAKGGFLNVQVLPAMPSQPATITFKFHHELGEVLHHYQTPRV
ncbi:alkaline phosphatase D family protein [Planctomicrobium sp. SH661]|uniref:alkaline phosphatase D family protein n=1 Tax=Planctomicrobium sp. SH661 TaxID=3448124 RepID=UPI003F5BC71C